MGVKMNKEDKKFLELCKDMGFWFDNVVCNDELLERYYNLTQQREEEYKNLESDHNILIDELQNVQENMSKEIKRQSDARKRFANVMKEIKKAISKYKDNNLIENDKSFIEIIKNDYQSLFDLKCDLNENMEISNYSFEEYMRTIKHTLCNLELLVDLLEILTKGGKSDE